MSIEMNRNSSKAKYKEMNVDKLSMEEQSSEWWKYFMNQESSPITDLFQGQLVNRIHCEHCGHDSLAFDTF
jgi:ubiquitin C-terminal hydrolase